MRAWRWLCVMVVLAGASWGQPVVQGQVLGPDGQPRPDALVAQVYAVHWETLPERNPDDAFDPLAVDANGVFTLAVDERGLIRHNLGTLAMTAEGVGRATAAPNPTVDPATGAVLELHVPIVPWQTCGGEVTDAAGQPIAGATVTVAQVEVSTSDLARRLRTEIWILADVRDDLPPMPEPYSGNRQLPWPTSWPALTTTTDADGRWTLDRCPAQGAELKVAAPGWGAATVEVMPGRGQDVGQVTLRQLGGVRGRLVDGAGQPIAGRRIYPAGPWAETQRGAQTDADGRFEVVDLFTGEQSLYGLDFQSDWQLYRHSVTVTGGAVTDLGDVVASLARRLVVNVRNAVTGEPVPDIGVGGTFIPHLSGVGEEPRTGADGQAILRLPAAWQGDAMVRTQPHDAWLAADHDPIASTFATLPATGEFEPMTIELYPARALSGRVVDEAGAPQAALDVDLRLATSAVNPVTTAADGGFTFPQVFAAGPATLTVAERSGYERYRAEVDLAALPATGWQVVVPTVARVTLRGRVVDGAGQPVAAAGVAIAAGGERRHTEVRTWTADDGTFEAADLPAGLLYRATPQLYGYERVAPHDLAPEATDFGDLVLRRLGGQVRGTVVDAAGAPVGGALVWVGGQTDATWARRDGTFTIDGLPPGEATLFATDGDRAVGQLTTAPDQPPVTVTLAPLPAPDGDAEHAAALDLLHELAQWDRGEAWWRAGVPVEVLTLAAPADALAVVTALPATERAPVLRRVWPDLARLVPHAALAQVDTLDALTPAQAAAGRLLLALGLLEAGNAAGATTLAAAAALPADAPPRLAALAALVDVRLDRPGAAARWAAAAAALPAPGAETDGSLLGLAGLVGERAELLADLPADPAGAPLWRPTQLRALARHQPALAATQYVAWLAAAEPETLAARLSPTEREVQLLILDSLPPAERVAWVDQLPPSRADLLRPVAILLSDRPADIVAHLGRQPLPDNLRLLAARVLPDLLRPIVRALVPREAVNLSGLPLGSKLLPGLTWVEALGRWGQDPLAPRPAGLDLAERWDGNVAGWTLWRLANVDIERTMALIALGPPGAERATEMLRIAEELSIAPADRWQRHWTGTYDSIDVPTVGLRALMAEE